MVLKKGYYTTHYGTCQQYICESCQERILDSELNCPVCDGSNPEHHDNNYRYDLDDLDSDSDSPDDGKDNSNTSNSRISDLKAREEDLVANLRIIDQHISQTEFPYKSVLNNHARLRADLQRIQNELTELETKTSFRCPAAARRVETMQCRRCEQPFRISAANIDAHICTDCFARRSPTTTNTNHDQTTSSSERTCLLCAEANIEPCNCLPCLQKAFQNNQWFRILLNGRLQRKQHLLTTPSLTKLYKLSSKMIQLLQINLLLPGVCVRV
eukprot:g57947.t1